MHGQIFVSLFRFVLFWTVGKTGNSCKTHAEIPRAPRSRAEAGCQRTCVTLVPTLEYSSTQTPRFQQPIGSPVALAMHWSPAGRHGGWEIRRSCTLRINAGPWPDSQMGCFLASHSFGTYVASESSDVVNHTKLLDHTSLLRNGWRIPFQFERSKIDFSFGGSGHVHLALMANGISNPAQNFGPTNYNVERWWRRLAGGLR